MSKQEMLHMIESVNKVTIGKSQLAMLIYDECKNINFRKYNVNHHTLNPNGFQDVASNDDRNARNHYNKLR